MQDMRDRGGQGRFSVINMSDRADVHMRLRSGVFLFFCHSDLKLFLFFTGILPS
jgi:hypothetical protein